MRHDGRRYLTNGLRRREQPAPGLHQRQNGRKPELRRAGDDPPDHLPATPVERGQRHSHHLKAELERDVDQGGDAEPVLRNAVPESVLGKLEKVRRAVNVTLRSLED